MDKQWDDVAQKQYEKVKKSIKQVMPVDPKILVALKSLRYCSSLGLSVDFAYHIGRYWRINRNNLITDDKKKHHVKIRTNYVFNNVARFLTFAKQHCGGDLQPACFGEAVRKPEIFSKFLWALTQAGRKKDSLFSNISSLRKFDQFMTAGKWLPKSNAFEENVEEVKSLLYPVIQMHSDRLAAQRVVKADRIANFSPEEYSLLVCGEELDEVISAIANKNLNDIAELKPMIMLTMGLTYLIFVFFNSSRLSDATTASVQAFKRAIDVYEMNDDDEFMIIRGHL